MVWTQEARDYFFGTNTETNLSSDATETELEKDRFFSERYCSARTQSAIENGSVETEQVRKALRFLTSIVQSGRHTTPGWSCPRDKLPLVSIGYPILQNRPHRPTVVLRDTCIGLYARNGQLFLWTDTKSLEEFCETSSVYRTFESDWNNWHSHKSLLKAPFTLTSKDFVLRFLEFVESKLSERQKTEGYSQLIQILLPCREVLGDSTDWTVIYPRLSSFFDEQSGNDDPEDAILELMNPSVSRNRVAKQKSRKLPLKGYKTIARSALNDEQIQVDDSPIDFGNSKSMLEILRILAIARVRTVLPTFDNNQLDEWILNTGSNSAHNNTAGLFYLYAASITNAGGAKPKYEQFGRLVMDAIEHYGDGNLSNVPKDIKSFAEVCSHYLHKHKYSLGGKFNEDIDIIAKSGQGRILMCRLLLSVLAFVKMDRSEL